MPKISWGKKIVCPNCETRFYDLNRKYPLACPNCGHQVEEVSTEILSDAKKVFSDDVKSVNESNLVGSDATESIASEDNLALEEVEDDATISLEEADQDVDVIDTEVDDISINEGSNNDEED